MSRLINTENKHLLQVFRDWTQSKCDSSNNDANCYSKFIAQ